MWAVARGPGMSFVISALGFATYRLCTKNWLSYNVQVVAAMRSFSARVLRTSLLLFGWCCCCQLSLTMFVAVCALMLLVVECVVGFVFSSRVCCMNLSSSFIHSGVLRAASNQCKVWPFCGGSVWRNVLMSSSHRLCGRAWARNVGRLSWISGSQRDPNWDHRVGAWLAIRVAHRHLCLR